MKQNYSKYTSMKYKISYIAGSFHSNCLASLQHSILDPHSNLLRSTWTQKKKKKRELTSKQTLPSIRGSNQIESQQQLKNISLQVSIKPSAFSNNDFKLKHFHHCTNSSSNYNNQTNINHKQLQNINLKPSARINCNLTA